MSGEQSEETKSTGGSGENLEPTTQAPEPKEYKPVTLRARGNTSWFFDRVQALMSENNMSTADAAERTLVELKEQSETIGLINEEKSGVQKELEKWKGLAESNQSEIERLTKLISSDEQPKLQDNEHIVVIDPKVVRILNYVAKKRFEHAQTRERYKLTEQENIGQILINCLLTEDILFDFNNCFYTGLTREQLREFSAGRESANP